MIYLEEITTKALNKPLYIQRFKANKQIDIYMITIILDPTTSYKLQ